MTDRETVIVVAIAVALIAILTGLYVLKRQRGWTGWRSWPPRIFALALGRVVWVIAKKVPWKPILIWGPWVAMLLGLAFYGVENWRGGRAWAKYEEQVKSRGESLVFDDYLPPVVSEENNVFAHPAVVRLSRAGGSRMAVDDLKGIAGRINAPRMQYYHGYSVDVRDWLLGRDAKDLTEAEAIARVDRIAAPLWADLDALAEALERPGFRMEYERRPFLTMPAAGMAGLAEWAENAYHARAILRAKQGRGEECARDLAGLRKAPRLLAAPSASLGPNEAWSLYTLHPGALWEALRVHALTEEHLIEVERDLRAFDSLNRLTRAFRMERCTSIEGIDYYTKNRKEAVDFVGSMAGVVGRRGPAGPKRGGIKGVGAWVKGKWYEGELRFGPRGWFERAKVSSGTNWDEWIEVCASGDYPRVRRKVAEAPGYDPHAIPPERRPGIAGLIQGPTMLAPAWVGQMLTVQTAVALQRVAVAMERYYLREGSYPRNESELVPGFLPEWPLDPRSGERLVLKVEADGTFRVTAGGREGLRGGRAFHWRHPPSE